MTSRGCVACGISKPRSEFSNRQWRKNIGRSRCNDCLTGPYEARSVSTTARNNGSSGASFSKKALRKPFEQGSFRWVAKGVYVDGPRAGQLCVAKWFKSGFAVSSAAYQGDIKCARKALEIVHEFNSDNIIGTHIRVNIPEIWEFTEDSGMPGVKHMQEPFIEEFQKWNSNSGWFDDSSEWALAMQALSHYSYHKTGGAFVLCDIQGGVNEDGAILTDPAIISRSMTYGTTDLGPDGISNFFYRHKCNNYCDPDWAYPVHTYPMLNVVYPTTMVNIDRHVDENWTDNSSSEDEDNGTDDQYSRTIQFTDSWDQEYED